MFFLSFVLVTPSVILLRWLAQTNMPFKTWILTRLHLSTGDRTRKPRTVWGNPIAWRKARTKASATKASLLRYAFMAVGILGSLGLAYEFSGIDESGPYIRSNSYEPSTQVLTVYEKDSVHRYQLTASTTLTFKQKLSDSEGRAASADDLRHHDVIKVQVNQDNTLADIALAHCSAQDE